MVECASVPLADRVTRRAFFICAGGLELPSVNILVTFRTARGRVKEIRGRLSLRQRGTLSRTVTTHACGGLVGAFQLELCCAVIEQTDFLPLVRVVTTLASLRGSMRIVMTTRAVLFSKVILAGCRSGRHS